MYSTNQLSKIEYLKEFGYDITKGITCEIQLDYEEVFYDELSESDFLTTWISVLFTPPDSDNFDMTMSDTVEAFSGVKAFCEPSETQLIFKMNIDEFKSKFTHAIFTII